MLKICELFLIFGERVILLIAGLTIGYAVAGLVEDGIFLNVDYWLTKWRGETDLI